MLNRSASLAMSTSVLKALPGKLDIKRHSPSILYIFRHQLVICHSSKRTRTFLKYNGILILKFTRNSPEMNSIDNVSLWNIMKKEIGSQINSVFKRRDAEARM